MVNSFLRYGIIYGPVRSRRLGRSLGIDLLPLDRKACTFNCCYCPYGWTPPNALDVPESAWPSTSQVLAALEDWFVRAARRRERIDRLILAGHGEPTLHPRFPAMVAALADVRARLAPRARLAVLSNSSTADDPAIRFALTCLDDRFMKLDAGAPALPCCINGAGDDRARVVDALRLLSDITVQSVFVTHPQRRMDNSTDEAVEPWLPAVAAICPRAVHVCTLDEPGAWPLLQPVPRGRLKQIASQVRRLGIDAEAFG